MRNLPPRETARHSASVCATLHYKMGRLGLHLMMETPESTVRKAKGVGGWPSLLGRAPVCSRLAATVWILRPLHANKKSSKQLIRKPAGSDPEVGEGCPST